MIADVRLDGFTTAPLPAKFEAGTPPITEAIGLGAAVRFLEGLGMANVRRHELEMAEHAMRTLTERFGDDIQIHGPRNPEVRAAVGKDSYYKGELYTNQPLNRQFGYSVGIVGKREHLPALAALRRALRPEIYLWVNAYRDEGPNHYGPDDLAPVADLATGVWCQGVVWSRDHPAEAVRLFVEHLVRTVGGRAPAEAAARLR